MGQAEEIGWGSDSSRLGEALASNLRRQSDPNRALLWQADRYQPGMTREKINLFAGVENEADLNKVQRAANKSVDWWWADKSKEWASLSEDFVRYASFIRGVRQYGAADNGRTAALLSRGLHFDYGDLSPIEDKWMRGTLIPFYVWSRNNVPLQVRAMMKDPGKMNKVGITKESLEDVWGDDEQDMVPEWMRDKFGFVSRFGSNAAGDRLLIGLETPAYDINQWLKVGNPSEAGWSMARNLASNVSPVFKLPLEHLGGTDWHTGARLDTGGALAPAWMSLIPGATWTDKRGQHRMRHTVDKALKDVLPPVGQAMRLIPGLGAPDLAGRRRTSWAATLAAAPLATQTPRQEAGETLQRAEVFQRRFSQMDHAVVEQARELLKAGYSPEQVRGMLDI